MRVTRFLAALSLVAAAALATVPVARADTPTPVETSEAVALYDEGSRLLRGADPEASIGPLEKSYALFPSPNTELLIAHAIRQLGKPASAIERYVRVRDTAKARVSAGELRYRQTREEAVRWIASLAPEVGQVTVEVASAPDGAVVRVGERTIAWRDGKSLQQVRAYVEPGLVHVEMRDTSGRLVAETDVEVGRGATAVVKLAGPAPRPEPEATVQRPLPVDERPLIPPPPTATWIAGGVGVAGMISFAVAGGVALANADDLEPCAPRCDANDPDLVEARDTGQAAATIANVSVTIGALGLVSGTLLWALWPTDDDTSPPPPVTFDVGPAAFRVRGSF